IEFYGSFKEMFEFFCKNTTIHGTVRLVCSGRNRMKTAFWTLLLLASLAMLYWQFALMLGQFWAYPVVLTMSVDSEPKMFPAVTICNLDPSRWAEIMVISYPNYGCNKFPHNPVVHTIHHNTSEQLLPYPTNNPHTKDNPIPFPFPLSPASQCNSTGGNCFYTSHPSGMDALLEWYRFHYVNVMAQLPPGPAPHPQHFQDLVYSCQYDGEPCRPGWVRGAEGHRGDLGREWGRSFSWKGGWSSGRAARGGGGVTIPGWLSLILRAEQKEHIPLLSTVAGVKVMIHSHNQTPFLEHEGFHVRPGIATTIGIRQDQVNRLGGNYGRCTTDGADVAVELLYNNSYTLQACLHSCFQRAMLQRCGCGYFYYPLPAGARYCDYSRQPAWGHCFYQLYSRLRNHRLDCFQHCPKPCR
ncbi:SCNNA protein, partial [Motacilla alba]|nr:SCNNA protein [Motacilla alba]